MKKKVRKIVLLIILILLIIFLLLAGFFVINYIEVYSFTVSEINGDSVTGIDISSERVKNISDENTRIKDVNGKDINSSQVNIGDNIYVQDEEMFAGNVDKRFVLANVTNIENGNISVKVPDYSYYSFKADKNKLSKLNLGDTIRVIDWPDWIQYDVAVSKSGYSVEKLDNVIWMTKLKQDSEELELINNVNKKAIKEAVVVRVNKDSLDAMGLEDTTDLFTVSFSKEGNIEFKEGQEILIYFNGNIAQGVEEKEITEADKIEIAKNQSEIQIPREVLMNFYSSYDNVKISVDYINKNGLSFTIKDMNKLKYDYPSSYTLLRKDVKSEPSETQENGYSQIRCICF